jgi:hypothetical protein
MHGDDQKKNSRKEPIEMTTDEALDYVFHPEIAEALRREAAKDEPPDDCDEQND